MPQHIEDFCEDKARAGDGSFAIAFALFRLADAQKDTAYQLGRLGLGDAASPMGALEHLTLHISQGFDGVTAALRDVAERD